MLSSIGSSSASSDSNDMTPQAQRRREAQLTLMRARRDLCELGRQVDAPRPLSPTHPTPPIEYLRISHRFYFDADELLPLPVAEKSSPPPAPPKPKTLLTKIVEGARDAVAPNPRP